MEIIDRRAFGLGNETAHQGDKELWNEYDINRRLIHNFWSKNITYFTTLR